jgi:hypothetical protein
MVVFVVPAIFCLFLAWAKHFFSRVELSTKKAMRERIRCLTPFFAPLIVDGEDYYSGQAGVLSQDRNDYPCPMGLHSSLHVVGYCSLPRHSCNRHL